MSEELRVGRNLVIPRAELAVRFSASGGPGGQHANKTSTRVELTWNVERSEALGPRQRERLRKNLRHRIDSEGNLRVVSDARRSQMRNRSAAEERLVQLVAAALRPPKPRIDTAPTKASKERRLQAKRRRSEIKRARRRSFDD